MVGTEWRTAALQSKMWSGFQYEFDQSIQDRRPLSKSLVQWSSTHRCSDPLQGEGQMSSGKAWHEAQRLEAAQHVRRSAVLRT